MIKLEPSILAADFVHLGEEDPRIESRRNGNNRKGGE
jgi:pentose-5-phosphate-3-epimerase